MSEQYQEDPTTKKSVKPKHSFKKPFSRHSQVATGSPNSLTASSGSGDAASSFNPASMLLDELIKSLTSLYMNTKKQ